MTPERIARLRSVLDRRQPDLTVITDFVHKGRNLSAIVRNADAFGVLEMHCVIEDRDYRAFRGTAMGSQQWVDVKPHHQLADAVEPLKAQGYQLVAAHLSERVIDYREVDYTRPTALLLGAEKRGVSQQGLEMADQHITVPMVGMVESLNVSVASGIILSEAQRQRQEAGLFETVRVDQERYQRLFFEWGHPKVRDYCRAHGLEYPPLREDGEIEDPSGWYTSVRERLADAD